MATIKLSDYIMEQEVSTASCEDIVLEQLQAEINVNVALAEAYAKQILMMEYAEGYSSDLYSEADTSTDTKSSAGSKIKGLSRPSSSLVLRLQISGKRSRVSSRRILLISFATLQRLIRSMRLSRL